MIFRQSAVSNLTRDTVYETSPSLPLDIHCAYLGSGEIGVGIDATGMQGLNARLMQFRDTTALWHGTSLTTTNLHIYRDEAISEHYRPHALEERRHLSLLPGGWFDYLLTIDEHTYDARGLRAHAMDWAREFSPRTGILITRFSIGPVSVEWKTAVAPDAVEVDCGCTIRSRDGQPHRVSLTVRCHQTLRDGRPLATGGIKTVQSEALIYRRWVGTNDTSAARLLQPITIAWALACDQPATFIADEERITVQWEGNGTDLAVGFRIVSGSDRDGTDGQAYAESRAAALQTGGMAAALASTALQWSEYLNAGAEIWIGDPEKEFMLAQQQYLLRAGFHWHAGLPLGTLWNQHFGGATFWDSLFVSDGMLRAGHTTFVRQFCDWIVRSSRPEGRPHYWMTFYDGTPACDPDEAYQVNLAFSCIGIRLYEITRDRDDLELRVFPYLYRTAEALFALAITHDATGWHPKGDVSGDVDQPAGDAKAEVAIWAWVVAVLGKCVEYAAILGVDDDLIARCRAIDAQCKAQPIDLNRCCLWDTWLPFLIGVSPHADWESWWQYAYELYSTRPTCLYQGQPWPASTISCSLTMTGHPDPALQFQDDTMKYISGLGYMDQGPYEWRMGGFGGYPPATGSFISSILVMLAHGELWSDEVQVCVGLPQRWRYQRLRFRDVRTLNGASVSAWYAPRNLSATIRLDRPHPVRLRIPARMAGEPMTVTQNGTVVSPRVEGETIVLDLPAGEFSITLARDLESTADVLLLEPLNQAAALVTLLESAGHTVRLHRDIDDIPCVVHTAPVLVLHECYVAMPVETVKTLETAVCNGASLVTLLHAGCAEIDGPMAALTGVRARLGTGHWDCVAFSRTYHLTETGRASFSGLPATFTVPVQHDFLPELLADVEVLAVDDRNQPVITRRPLGAGWVYWIAAGGKVMNYTAPEWHEQGRMTIVWGQDFEDRAERMWLNDAQWQTLLTTIVRDAQAHARVGVKR